MHWSPNRLPLLVALLLVTSAALFAVGTAIEHSQRAQHHETSSATASTTKSVETSTEKQAKGETSPIPGETTPVDTASTPTAIGETRGETHSENLAGIDPESWPLVALAIIVTLLVAAGCYWRRGRWLVVAAGFAVLSAAADTRELTHQLNESRTTVATIAGILIALHLVVALVAGAACMRREGVTEPRSAS